MMRSQTYKMLSNFSFILGFASVLGSIAIWFFQGESAPTPDAKNHAELFSIFVGLWTPTFFILSNRLDRYADQSED